MINVYIVERRWQRLSHVGQVNETDYSVYINKAELRRFSTHGDMQNGYYGKRAKECAEAFALSVALAVNCSIIHMRIKR